MENNDKLKALAGKRAEVSEDEMNSVCGGVENLGRFPEEDYDDSIQERRRKTRRYFKTW